MTRKELSARGAEAFPMEVACDHGRVDKARWEVDVAPCEVGDLSTETPSPRRGERCSLGR